MPTAPDVSRPRFAGFVKDGTQKSITDPLIRKSRALPLDGEAEPGACVVVRVAEGRATVTDVLAEAGSPRAQLYAIAFQRGVDPVFPDDVMNEVRELLGDDGIADTRLLDLTHAPFVTIDEATSMDLDQAVFVEPTANGHVVWYALADAAWFVRRRSALFREALLRASSYYLPGLSIPMLPRELSEGIISLNPGVDRRAMVMRIELDSDSRCRSMSVERARIRSRAKLSFDGVQAFLDRGDHDGWSDDVRASLRALEAVGRRRTQIAEDRNVVRYRRVEVSVTVEGVPVPRFVMAADPRNDVEIYNEQISLLCNVEGAKLMRRQDRQDDDVHPIYRVHPAPEESRMEAFEGFVRRVVNVHRLPKDRWLWDRDDHRSLADYLRELPTDGQNRSIAEAIHRQALLSNGRSVFRTEPGAHFGIGAPVYARFSAPMREIVGVVVHQQTWRLLKVDTPEEAMDDRGEALSDEVIERANQARERQKHLTKDANELVLNEIFQQDLNQSLPPREGVIVGMTPSRVHVLLNDPPVDVKVYLDGLTCVDEGVRYLAGSERTLRTDRDGVRLTDLHGTTVLAAGDAVALTVRANDQGRWRFDVSRVEPKGQP